MPLHEYQESVGNTSSTQSDYLNHEAGTLLRNECFQKNSSGALENNGVLPKVDMDCFKPAPEETVKPGTENGGTSSSEGKPSKGKPGIGKPDEGGKPEGGKPDGGKPDGGKPDKGDEGKPGKSDDGIKGEISKDGKPVIKDEVKKQDWNCQSELEYLEAEAKKLGKPADEITLESLRRCLKLSKELIVKNTK